MSSGEFHEVTPRRRADGRQTHDAIVAAAVRIASMEGLEALSVGRLARELGVSKSGVFAHFGSRERLQLETVEAARAVFQREVLEPALAAPAGLARLEAVCEAYLSYVERGVFPGGCFFAQMLGEFDGRDGPLHDEVLADQRDWVGLLTGLIDDARRRGELAGDTDVDQLAFELHAAMDAANFLSTLYREPAPVNRGRVAVRAAIDRSR